MKNIRRRSDPHQGISIAIQRLPCHIQHKTRCNSYAHRSELRPATDARNISFLMSDGSQPGTSCRGYPSLRAYLCSRRVLLCRYLADYYLIIFFGKFLAKDCSVAFLEAKRASGRSTRRQMSCISAADTLQPGWRRGVLADPIRHKQLFLAKGKAPNPTF